MIQDLTASLRRVGAVLVSRSAEYARDRSSVIRNLFMPLIIIAVVAYGFSGPQKPLFKVACLGTTEVPHDAAQPFTATRLVQFYAEPDVASGLQKVRSQQIDMAVDFTHRRYWVNDLSAKASVVQDLLAASGGPPMIREHVQGTMARYVDWVVPGVLGLNIVMAGLFGISNVIVGYRKSGYLKRLAATPLRPMEFLIGQVLSRVLIVVVVNAVVFVACRQLLGLRMIGSYLDLLLVTTLGVTAVAALALFISARSSSEELVTGILNFVAAAMMLVSGAFFSIDGAPRPLRLIADLSPLTHLLRAVRAIMLDGAGLADLGGSLAALTLMSVMGIAAASLVFKWRSD